MGNIGRIVSVLFWMAISVAVGLAAFVFLTRLVRRVAPGVANTAANLTGVAA